MKSLIKNENAFTLLEVMIAVLLLSIVLIPVMSIYVQSSKAYHQSGDQLIALNLAQGIVEECKAVSFDQISEVVQQPIPSEVDYPQFQYSLEIENEKDAYNYGLEMIKITVTVFYNSGGKEDSVVLSTLRLKRWNSEG